MGLTGVGCCGSAPTVSETSARFWGFGARYGARYDDRESISWFWWKLAMPDAEHRTLCTAFAGLTMASD